MEAKVTFLSVIVMLSVVIGMISGRKCWSSGKGYHEVTSLHDSSHWNKDFECPQGYPACITFVCYTKQNTYLIKRTCTTLDFCESEKNKNEKEDCMKNGDGFDFKCVICPGKDNCNDPSLPLTAGPQLKCWDTIEKTFDSGFIEVKQLDGTSVGKLKECTAGAQFCGTKVCKKTDDTGFLVWKGCLASTSINNCEEDCAPFKASPLSYGCYSCQGDNCNTPNIKPAECWTTDNKWEDAKSENENVGKGGVRCTDDAPYCTKMTCSNLGEKPYKIAKGCGQSNFCDSKEAKKREEECVKEGGNFDGCATPCSENNCNSDFKCMSNKGFGFKEFVPRNDRNNMSIGNEVRCSTKYCGMHVCTKRDGTGYNVFNDCADEDFCKDGYEKYCASEFDADYRCIPKCQENKCNERIPKATKVRKCWTTDSEGDVEREDVSCEDYQPLCITKTCTKKVAGAKKIITKGCGRKDYCTSEEGIKAKKECEGEGKEKKGEFSCNECDTDNCNIYRKCWKTERSENFGFVEVEDSNPYKRIVFDKEGHTCNQTDVCFTEICKDAKGKFMVHRGCAEPGYCKGRGNFCNKQFVGGSHHECRECRDNDHCNGPWDPPAPAPAEPQESSAGTNLKGHHLVTVIMGTWVISMFIVFYAFC